MKNFLKVSFLLTLFLGTAQSWAEPDWSFLPATPIFKPTIGDPREYLTGITGYLDQVQYVGQLGEYFEFVRYSPEEATQFGWGLFASGLILLGEDGATFPMLDGDFYIGTYFSGSFGDFSIRLEALHESTHLGDSFQTIQNGTLQSFQTPLFYNPTVTYTRENANVTFSFQPTDDPIFASFGTEVYSPFWSIDNSAMRGYLTGSLQWKGDQNVLETEVQLGLQWKTSKSSNRAIRMAILYYTGDSQFGQFYNVPDSHWGLATFF